MERKHRKRNPPPLDDEKINYRSSSGFDVLASQPASQFEKPKQPPAILTHSTTFPSRLAVSDLTMTPFPFPLPPTSTLSSSHSTAFSFPSFRFTPQHHTPGTIAMRKNPL